MSVEQRIHYFNFIRDIPYKIGWDGVTDHCCSSKCQVLADLLEGIGLETRQIICEFEWEDTPLPEGILDLPRQTDDVTHQFIEVFIPEADKWVKCDPTWDVPLEKAGFQISEWDGISDTIIAVKPTKIYTPEETIEYKKKWNYPNLIEDHFKHHHKFYVAINTWMMEFR